LNEIVEEDQRLLYIGLEYAHIYLRNYMRNIHIKNVYPMIFLYLKDFSDEKMKSIKEIEFLRQTPFFPLSKEQEIRAVY